MSEVYAVLEHVCTMLQEERTYRERAEACLEAVVEELEAKGPMILQQRQESEAAKMASQQVIHPRPIRRPAAGGLPEKDDNILGGERKTVSLPLYFGAFPSSRCWCNVCVL